MPKQESAFDPFKFMFQAHPWHGVTPGKKVPETVNAYIEIVPTDAVKYELDKETGHLRVDRPQRFSSMCPSLYGFIPQTFCGDHVADLCAERTGMTGIKGDGDPMDICVLTEKTFAQGNFFVQATPIGGLRMIDGEQAEPRRLVEKRPIFGRIGEAEVRRKNPEVVRSFVEEGPASFLESPRILDMCFHRGERRLIMSMLIDRTL